MAEERRENDKAPKWDKNRDGIPDVLDDPAKRKELLKKYGYTEGDLRTKAKRDLFYEAVRKEYSRKEAKESYNEVYVNDEATVREIVDESGFTMELLRAYPELRDVFRRLSDMLARGKITEAELYPKFKELIAKTAFGKRTNSEIAADLDRYGRNNQANWRQRVSRVVTRISEFLTAESGGTMDDATAEALAIELIYAGEEQDQSALARRVRAWIKENRDPDVAEPVPGEDAEFQPGGDRGRYRIQLANWFTANGLVVSRDELEKYIDDIVTGASDIEQIKQFYRDNRLAVMYPGFADDFKRGMDAANIALDYRSVMASLLERTIEDINFEDPLVQRAMQRRGEDGKPRPMTRYEFEQEIRGTDEWQKTDNAMSLYTDVGEGILRSFGFRG